MTEFSADTANISSTGACCHAERGPRENVSRQWLRIAIAAVLAGQTMMLSLGLNTAEVPPAFASGTWWLLHGGLIVSSLAVFFLLGLPLLQNIASALRQREVTVEALFLLSVIGAFVGSLINTFTGQGAVYYEVVVIVLAIYSVGRVIGAQSRAKALDAASELRDEFSTAWVRSCCGKCNKIPVAELEVGAAVEAGPGEAIAVDGIIREGQASVRETAINGEIEPVRRQAGEPVFAGCYVVDGQISVSHEKPLGERRLDGILAAVTQAPDQPSTLQQQADRLTRWFVPFVVGVAVATFVGWIFLVPWTQALFNAMAVLLVACPCALGLATPIAVWSGLFRLSQLGLVTRRADFIDQLARVDHLMLDKTGTLSGQMLVLESWQALGAWSDRRELLAQLVRTAESANQHPVARALQTLPQTEEGATVKRLETVPGLGIRAGVEQADETYELALGDRALMPADVDFPESPGGKRSVFAAINGEPAGVFVLREEWRARTTDVLRALDKLGVRVSILSGDPSPAARELAGVAIQGGLSPDDKAALVREARARGERVVFVGDSVNDAAAMAEADASVAMEEGADLTRATASAVLAGENLTPLPRSVARTRRIRATIQRNLLFAAGYNTIGMSLAAAGILGPVIAALLMAGSSAFVSAMAVLSAR